MCKLIRVDLCKGRKKRERLEIFFENVLWFVGKLISGITYAHLKHFYRKIYIFIGNFKVNMHMVVAQD